MFFFNWHDVFNEVLPTCFSHFSPTVFPTISHINNVLILDIKALEAIVFDFDGVLTDNRVWVDQQGNESVCCNRSDGLGFDVLRKTSVKLYILSTETNPVVMQRGKKLKVPVHQGVKNKVHSLQTLAQDASFDLDKTLFVGNDLNDYGAMQLCGFSACPADSHPQILEVATISLKKDGGQGIVRELVEQVFEINMLEFLK